MNNSIDKLKASILESFEYLEENKIIPFGDFTKEGFNTKKQDFIDNKFIVSVCGAMNSGKSTLLNALVFKEDILPTKAVSMTSVLTTLHYCNKKYFEVVFYDKDEWEIVTKNNNQDEKCKKEFNELIDDLMQHNIYKEDYNNSIKIDDLNLISKYCGASTLSNDDSLNLSIFVKEVHIYYPSDILKEIIIVDTPGLFDNNIVRSNITNKWISNSNAAIFLTYAGGAFSSTDNEFIANYLIHTNGKNRIIVVNKSESDDDEEHLKEYINKLRNETKLISDEEIVFCSGLYSLLYMLKDDKNKWNASLKEQYELLEDQDISINELKKFDDKLEVLKNLIFERIIKSKHFNIFKTNKDYLLMIAGKKQNEFEFEIITNKELLKQLKLSTGNFEEELAEIKRKRSIVKSFDKKFTQETQNNIELLLRKIENLSSNEAKRLVLLSNNRIEESTPDQLKTILPTIINEYLGNDKNQEFLNNCESSFKQFESSINEQNNDIQHKLELQNIISKEIFNSLFVKISSRQLNSEIKYKIQDTLDLCISSVKKHTYLFIFKKKLKMQTDIKEISNDFWFNDFKNTIVSTFHIAINSYITDSNEQSFEQLNKILDNQDILINEIENNKLDKDNEIEKIQKSINSIESNLNSFIEIKNELDNKLTNIN